MIGPESRYFISKRVTTTIGKAKLSVPNVLFAETASTDMYGRSFEALLVPARLATDKVQFVASQNEMVHGAREAKTEERLVVMPNFIPFSSLIEGIEGSYQREKKGEVFISVGRDENIARELEDVTSKLISISNSPEISRDPYDMAMTLIRARESVGINRLLYVPGIATPQNLSLLIYSGADITDSAMTDLSSATGEVFVDGLVYRETLLDGEICFCRACTDGGSERALRHNRYQLLAELNRCRSAISDGRLREYVESRAQLSPWNSELLRYLDSVHYQSIEKYVPNAQTRIRAFTEHSFRRPDIVRYVNRVKERYHPPPLKIALLVPCSNRKPYFLSKSHRLFRDAMMQSVNRSQVHLITVTSPLGIVPEELETVFPAAHYDIPVTGQWSHEEKDRSLTMLDQLLSLGNYSLVVSHLEDERPFVNEALKERGVDFVDTSGGVTRSGESLRRLTEALDSAGKLPAVAWSERNRLLLSEVSAFQFGEGGRGLLSKTTVSGRYPNIRFFRDGVQLGMLTGQRGVISLTLQGADAIKDSAGDYTVEMDDFKLIGNLFAAGVRRAGPSIRIGDETIVTSGGAVTAVGVASMSAAEMNERKKGEAVHVRHVRKEEAGQHG